MNLSALVFPSICKPLTSQPINYSKESYEHLIGLELADAAEESDMIEIDVLIGADSYWDFVTGEVVRGNSGPTAIRTKIGWILSGPTKPLEVSVNLTFASTHTLYTDYCPSTETCLDVCLKRFWDLESLGIVKQENSVYEKFIQKITFNGHNYEVSLPWKECHPPLPDHYELCYGRLLSLLRRLRQTPQLLAEYDSIIQDQLAKNIIETVSEPPAITTDHTHYLPHHAVVRQDKSTSKFRIVYDASAKSSGPSLNECLYTGPKFGQSIFDILLRFRSHHVALAGDIEKAFLMLSMDKKDQDSLRFLWVEDTHVEQPKILVYRFTRVVFGVSSSHFLLNATINHHIETYRHADPQFVDQFLSSIYVDDLVAGSSDVESTYHFYVKSRERLSAAGFNLRKFVTNSEKLRKLIQSKEHQLESKNKEPPAGTAPKPTQSLERPETLTHAEEDQSYAKTTLGVKTEQEDGVHKILGVEWDVGCDNLQFSLAGVAIALEDADPTKRSVVSATARFFDPFGVVSPVTILFKMFAQQLCVAGVGWDEFLTGDLLKKWKQLLAMMKDAPTISFSRCFYRDPLCSIQSAKLVGFCDASSRAYAAVVYLKVVSDTHQVNIRFVAAKTRVTPTNGSTIPRLELLSALLLSKLIDSVHSALQQELQLTDPTCFTDSKVALFWIQGTNHEWKQFVENRVNTIRQLVAPNHWKHCPGKDNPVDIPSRGASASELSENPLWLNGLDWLCSSEDTSEEPTSLPIPEDCCTEMRSNDKTHILVVHADHHTCQISELIDIERYSSVHRLFRVTALVLKFINTLRRRIHPTDTTTDVSENLTQNELDLAKLHWIKDCQSQLQTDKRFESWKRHLDLYQDESGVWRCGGRMSKSSLSLAAQNPVLLNKDHLLTRLIVVQAHQRVYHDGVKETLTELRSEYWLVKGRQFIRKVVHDCTICKKLEEKPCHSNAPPPLPDYRVTQTRPFQTTGVDFAGPLFVKTSNGTATSKVWLCLYTCSSTRAVHLDLVIDMTATTFIRSFRRFSAR